MFSRRDALKLSAVAGVGMVLPAQQLASALSDDPPVVTPFSVPLPIPPVLRPVTSSRSADHYEMVVTPATARIFPGLDTRVLTFNGSFPGPTIRSRRGRAAIVKVTNKMSTPAAVHLHGANVAPESDGHPLDTIDPGASRLYHYPNSQPAATLWYHDHAHHVEAEQVYRGLTGAYLISDSETDALRLPSGEFDIPLVIRDAQFDGDGQLVWKLDDFANRKTVLVNGAIQPTHKVKRRKYRLRLINAANSRPLRLALNPASEVIQIASDGGLLGRPVARPEVELWPAERAEIVIDFSKFPSGSNVILENTFNGPETPGRQLLRFEVTGSVVADDSVVPAKLRDLEDLGTPTVTRRIVLARDPTNTFYAIDGKAYDPKRIDLTVKRGTTELWEVVNDDGQYNFPHSIHLHLVQFRVLERAGQPVGEWEAYPKDTARVPAGQTVKILVKFDSEFTGVYPFHCHFFDHSSMAMMANMQVLP
ncbi:multicopper oxidase domain-containing protein [Lentzea sp. NPDC051208]|uniref:multicopper oxidase family protein n=1 Tax=Lentzea sp. NPDC051208 TaxID=3154642 RepID=UPI0034368149